MTREEKISEALSEYWRMVNDARHRMEDDLQAARHRFDKDRENADHVYKQAYYSAEDDEVLPTIDNRDNLMTIESAKSDSEHAHDLEMDKDMKKEKDIRFGPVGTAVVFYLLISGLFANISWLFHLISHLRWQG